MFVLLSYYIYTYIYIYIYNEESVGLRNVQYHIGRANSNSNSISLTSKPQQSVSLVGNLQAFPPEDSPRMK